MRSFSRRNYIRHSSSTRLWLMLVREFAEHSPSDIQIGCSKAITTLDFALAFSLAFSLATYQQSLQRM